MMVYPLAAGREFLGEEPFQRALGVAQRVVLPLQVEGVDAIAAWQTAVRSSLTDVLSWSTGTSRRWTLPSAALYRCAVTVH